MSRLLQVCIAVYGCTLAFWAFDAVGAPCDGKALQCEIVWPGDIPGFPNVVGQACCIPAGGGTLTQQKFPPADSNRQELNSECGHFGFVQLDYPFGRPRYRCFTTNRFGCGGLKAIAC